VQAIIGLGNPGRKYQETRHNIGFLIIDAILAAYKISPKPGKGDYYYAELDLAGKNTLLVKPTTYMNASGIAVKQLIGYYSIDLQDMLVVYDDFHLPFGTLRFRTKGSDGGHNGIESIIYQLKTESINRLRFGIGDQFHDSIKFVLSKFSRIEKKSLGDLIKVAIEGIFFWLENGIDEAMNYFNKSYI
jgi:PTH1 family peptidyl-tRNA hydrolase